MEADVERDATEPPPSEFRPAPIIGILRVSKEEGFKNSEGRRCRGGLQIIELGQILLIL